MLYGKAWQKSMRGLRMIFTVLLEDFVGGGIKSVGELEEILSNACETPTGRLWVDCLVTPLVIAHMFVRTEQEGNWLLHRHCMQRMVIYSMAAGHLNYARYIAWHVSEDLEEEVEAPFQRGEHVCRHK